MQKRQILGLLALLAVTAAVIGADRYQLAKQEAAEELAYQLFSLDCDGKELPFRESRVEFDFGFDSPTHQSFDPAAIAVFPEEVHGYLDNSTLLLTTESGAFRTGGSGADFRDDLSFLTDTQSYDNSKSLEENLRALEG